MRDLVDRQILGAELRPTMQLAPGLVIRDSTRRPCGCRFAQHARISRSRARAWLMGRTSRGRSGDSNRQRHHAAAPRPLAAAVRACGREKAPRPASGLSGAPVGDRGDYEDAPGPRCSHGRISRHPRRSHLRHAVRGAEREEIAWLEQLAMEWGRADQRLLARGRR